MPFQLAEAWRAGLPAYRPHDGAVLVPDGCIECCWATAEGLPGCDNPDLCEIDIPQHGYDANGYEEEWTLYIDAGNLGQRLRDQLFDLSEAQAFEQAHGLAIWTRAAQDQVVRVQEQGQTESGQVPVVRVPQLDPPESLPTTAREYNEQLRQRGYGIDVRMYMIRNAPAQGKWGKVRNWTAAAIALGRPVPEESDKDEIARLNNRYFEHVTKGLRDYLPKPKQAKKKKS